MKLKIFTGLSMLISAVTLGAACGRPHFHHGEITKEHVNRVSEKIADRLDMNESQKGKLKILSEKIAAKLPVIKKHRTDMSESVQKQFLSDSFDRKGMEAMMKGHQSEMEGMHSFAAQSLEEFHSILTPEQRKKVVDFMEKHRNKRRHGHF